MKYKVPIDASGRVVIPKPIREGLRLVKGTVLELEVEESRLVLSAPQPTAGGLTRRDGVLVAVGEVTGPIPTIEDIRADRIRQLAGL